MAQTRIAPAKAPFQIDEVVERIRHAVQPYPKAAMFELAELGYTTAFQQLVACIISIRTRDEVSLPTARRLFERASSPEEIASLPVHEIDRIIRTSTFHEAKARQIQSLARHVASEYGGVLPCDFELLVSFPGVGPKCANLALGIACGQSRISVDVHVHRVTNRWGYVKTRSPEQTTEALAEVLLSRYWIEINQLLVPFGKHICTGTLPRCSTCPVLEFCHQRGVGAHR